MSSLKRDIVNYSTKQNLYE